LKNRFAGPFDFQVNRLFLQFHIIYEVGTNVLLVRFTSNQLNDCKRIIFILYMKV